MIRIKKGMAFEEENEKPIHKRKNITKEMGREGEKRLSRKGGENEERK